MFNAVINEATGAMSSFMTLLFRLTSAVGLPYYGASIIIFTCIIKTCLYPLTWKQAKSMRRMAEVQPKMQELQKKFANDKQKLNQKIMELYNKENINPSAGCLPILIQLPVLWIFYRMLISFPYGEEASAWFLGYHLTQTYGWSDFAHWPLPVLVGATMYASTKISMAMNKSSVAAPAGKGKKPLPPPPNQAENIQKIMLTVMPFFLAYVSFSLPSGMSLYFVTMNVVSALQSYYMNKMLRRELARRLEAGADSEGKESKRRKDGAERTKKIELQESKTPSKS
jgi:YidC/Oxa1 family membrane protein insertase